MKKLKVFTEAQVKALESNVNQWLSENKNISILSSDLQAKEAEYLFYILYTISAVDEEGKLQTLAVVDQSSVSADTTKVVEVITQSDVPLKN